MKEREDRGWKEAQRQDEDRVTLHITLLPTYLPTYLLEPNIKNLLINLINFFLNVAIENPDKIHFNFPWI
jgi:hypothetical protein